MNILHFTESGGGVISVINQIAEETPDFQHYVFIRRRGQFSILEELKSKNIEVIEWQGKLLSGILKLRNFPKRQRIDLIHLHSSKAGLARLFLSKNKVVYSPHCFAFDRSDLDRLTRSLIRLIEYCLSFKTSAFLTVSQRETLLVHGWRKNIKTIRFYHKFNQWSSKTPIDNVVSIGRLCAQKNPMELIAIKQALDSSGIILNYMWVGDGERRFKVSLIQNGISVTGWLPRGEVIEVMRNALCLIHVAKWEGFPVVFGEAQAGGIPVIARKRNYSEDQIGIHYFSEITEALDIIKMFRSKKLRYSPLVRTNPGISRFYNELYTGK